MAMKQLFTNNAVSLLATGIRSSDTTLTVLPGHGDMFPTPQGNEFFTVTLEDQSASIQEIIHVTGRAGDLFIIERGKEGTQPRDWLASQGNDTLVDHRLTAWTLSSLSNAFSNPSFPSLTDYADAINYLLEGNQTTGEQIVDADCYIVADGNETIINTPSPYQARTTAVYVGGARQKRGVDFVEVNPMQIRLQFVLSQAQVDEGQNIVVDYILA